MANRPPPASDEPDVRAWFRAFHRWRWLMGSIVLVSSLGATVYAFTATPWYSATTVLLIAPEAPNVLTSIDEVIEDRQPWREEYLQTQYAMLRSRSLAWRTIDRLDLWDHPEFTSPLGDSDPKADSLAPDRDAAGRSQVVSRFLSRVSVGPLADSRLVAVTFDSPAPDLAAQVVNVLADEHIARDREFRGQSSEDASAWLRQRIGEYRERAEASELALQDYREEHGRVSLENHQDLVVQDLARLTQAATQAATDRIRIEARYRRVETLRGDAAGLDAISEIQANEMIRDRKAAISRLQREEAELSENYGDRHPRMIEIRAALEVAEAALQVEIATLIDSIRNEYLAAQSHERALRAELQARNEEALALNRAGLEYGVLRREAESNLQIYEALLRRANETGVSGDLRTSNVRVVDRAEVPLFASYPKRPVVLSAGLLGGVLVAFLVLLALDRLDNRLMLPEDVREHLGLPVLGTIPELMAQRWEKEQSARPRRLQGLALTPASKGGPAKAGSRSSPADSQAQFTDSVRFLRTNLMFSSAEPECRAVVVTSCWPGEGKTLIAISLARSLAQAFKRVLLIDADFRRPAVHMRLDEEMAREPGLSNLLVGHATSAIRPDVEPNLSVLPSGTAPPNPADLLGSARFGDYVASVKADYDWVIIDAPPVMVVPDAVALAHHVDDVVFAVDATKPTRRVGAASLERIAQVGGRVVGAVLNRTRPVPGLYYSSHYYRRQYSKYYATYRSA